MLDEKACYLCSNLSQMCFIMLRAGLCAGQSRSSTPNAEALRVTFTGTKNPSPTPERQSHRKIIPPSTKLYTMQSDKYHSSAYHHTQTHSLDCQETHDLSLHIMRVHCSSV